MWSGNENTWIEGEENSRKIDWNGKAFVFIFDNYSVPVLLGHDHWYLLCILYSWLIGRWWSEYYFIEVLKAITRYQLKWFWEGWTSSTTTFSCHQLGISRSYVVESDTAAVHLPSNFTTGTTPWVHVWTLVATTTLAEEVQWISSMPPLRHWTCTTQTSVQRTRSTLALSPGHSEILDILSHSCGENFSPLLQDKIWEWFSPQLWDKIWEWPGNKANSTLHLCWGRTPGWGRCTLGIAIFRVYILYT